MILAYVILLLILHVGAANGNTGHYRSCVRDSDNKYSVLSDSHVNAFPKEKLFNPERRPVLDPVTKKPQASDDNRLTAEDIKDPSCFVSKNCYILFYE